MGYRHDFTGGHREGRRHLAALGGRDPDACASGLDHPSPGGVCDAHLVPAPLRAFPAIPSLPDLALLSSPISARYPAVVRAHECGSG
jgi:hypothetical protein